MLNKNYNKNHEIKSPINGKAILIEETGDSVFADKILGEGVAVMPDDGTVVSPLDGTVTHISEEKQLYTITTADGVHILVHIGIGTVALNGEGIKPLVKVGESVKTGTPLAEVDIIYLREQGMNPCTPVILTGHGAVAGFEISTGTVQAGKDVIMTYTLN